MHGRGGGSSWPLRWSSRCRAWRARRSSRPDRSGSSCPSPPAAATTCLPATWPRSMTDVLKQQVIVENRAGAGGTIGSDLVAKAKPDGYTLLLGHTGTLAINPSLYPRLPYDANERLRRGRARWRPRRWCWSCRRRASSRRWRTSSPRRRRAGQAHLRLQRQRHRRPPGGQAAGTGERESACCTFPIAARRRR